MSATVAGNACSASVILSEGAISTSDAARLLPPGEKGKRVHNSTVARWTTRGVRRVSDGAVVKLEAARVGIRLVTSRAALERFMTALSAPAAPAPPPATSAARNAAAALESLGC